MFRRPNTPGRKGRWEPKPGELPPAWFGEKYGGFEDLENNPVFRYMKMRRRFPSPDILRDLLATPMQPREIIEAYIAYKNSRALPGGPWGAMLGIHKHMFALIGRGRNEFVNYVSFLFSMGSLIPPSFILLEATKGPPIADLPSGIILILRFLGACAGTMLLIGILADQKYTSPTRAYFDRWMDRRLAELEEFRLRAP